MSDVMMRSQVTRAQKGFTIQALFYIIQTLVVVVTVFEAALLPLFRPLFGL